MYIAMYNYHDHMESAIVLEVHRNTFAQAVYFKFNSLQQITAELKPVNFFQEQPFMVVSWERSACHFPPSK